jgi:hypothetical protein
MKKGMIQFTSYVPRSPKSHVRGWAMAWAQVLGATILEKGEELDGYDVIYIDQGVNYSPGTLNLFGGVDDSVVEHLSKIVDFDGDIVMLDYSLEECGYAELLSKRLASKASSNSECFNQDLVTDIALLTTSTLTMADVAKTSQRIVFGDSHSIAFAPANSAIMRRDGSTLFGELKSMRSAALAKQMYVAGKKVTLSFGSVDIRHHLGDRPIIEVAALAHEYVNYAKMFASSNDCEVELCAVVPVETELRRIPKTGYHNGRPFTGSQELRAFMTEVFNEELEKQCKVRKVGFVSPPSEWYEMDPTGYAKEIMETGSSVHIAPLNYRSKEWGV